MIEPTPSIYDQILLSQKLPYEQLSLCIINGYPVLCTVIVDSLYDFTLQSTDCLNIK